MINRFDSMSPLPLELGLESVMRLVVAVEAQCLEVGPVKTPLPAAFGLNRIDVMDLHGDGTAVLAAVACVLHLGLRQPFPVGRCIEAGVPWISFLVVARVPLKAFLLEHLLLLLLRNWLAGCAVDVRVSYEGPASRAWFQQHAWIHSSCDDCWYRFVLAKREF